MATFCARTFDQQPGNARRDDQYRCIRSGIAGLWQNVRSRTWRTRGVVGGDILDTQPLPVELAETLGKSNTTIGRIYNTVYQRCRQQRQLIIDNFPKLNRFLTGYDLRHVFNDEMTEFDLTRILTGSEGTLAFITEARLDITRLPKVRRLVNVKYDSFDSALRNAPFMVEARALSVETVDSKVLNLAREDIVWHSVSELITDVPDKEMLGLNIVEFAGDDEALIDERVNALCVRLDELIASQQAGVIGWQVCRELAGVERIYAMRKKPLVCLAMPKVLLSQFRLLRIPAYRRNTRRIILLNFARCSTATA